MKIPAPTPSARQTIPMRTGNRTSIAAKLTIHIISSSYKNINLKIIDILKNLY